MKEDLIRKLRDILDADRYYQESEMREEFFDLILKSNDNIDIFYINSNKATNCTYFFENKAVIVWDFQFWDFYQEYLYQAESCRINGFNLKQGVSAVSAKFLSKKYSIIPTLSHFICQIYTEFNFPVVLTEDKKRDIDRRVFLGKVFSFFHEVGHIVYRKNNNELIKIYQEIILKFFNGVPDDFANHYGVWSDIVKLAMKKIADREADDILEELVCDMFAAGETIHYTQFLLENNTAGLICEVLIAHEKLTAFQALFNAINEAWNYHYSEIKYGFIPQSHNVEDKINELVFDRNIIGDMLPTLLASFYEIAEGQMNIISRRIVEEHFNLAEAINCMTQDQFISTAIIESRS